MAQQQQRLVWAAAGELEETAEADAYPPWWVRVIRGASEGEWHLQRTLPNEPNPWRHVSRHESREAARQAAQDLVFADRVAELTGLSPEEAEAHSADLQRSAARVTGHQYGDYPWDRWQQKAIEAGLPVDLAQLGRAVMREAAQHGWDEDLCQEVGWGDEGAGMLELALRDPRRSRLRWQHLLDTDGLRRGPDDE